MIGPIAGLIDTALTLIFPDADERLKAKVRVQELESEGKFKDLDMRMSAILEEARSRDPWTSRARPGFLYVIYVLILSSIPFGILSAFYPEVSIDMSNGMKSWLAAIPPELYALFGAGYLGYTNKRSEDKATTLGQDRKQGLLSRILG